MHTGADVQGKQVYQIPGTSAHKRTKTSGSQERSDLGAHVGQRSLHWELPHRRQTQPCVHYRGPGSSSHGSDPPARSATCLRPRPQPCGRASGFKVGVGNICWGVIRIGTTSQALLSALQKPQLRRVSPRSDKHERTHGHLSLPDRQVSPQQQNGPQGGLRLPGECNLPPLSCLC